MSKKSLNCRDIKKLPNCHPTDPDCAAKIQKAEPRRHSFSSSLRKATRNLHTWFSPTQTIITWHSLFMVHTFGSWLYCYIYCIFRIVLLNEVNPCENEQWTVSQFFLSFVSCLRFTLFSLKTLPKTDTPSKLYILVPNRYIFGEPRSLSKIFQPVR